ncbi:hypothetical protein CC117_16235 [Parafrankia colletiae]|uniref:Tetratricopeptide repeat protein n=1 Tax=Parafrankia colletiae TaxID=573497 RepID=A0A1S1QWM9_9ACTN|nr:hypothetical protein [Parafrankia colletiae]MCK9899553.1 hypothetical protein [Frankia sp. Cpl3]OHV38006.1 hypothetical protein CC117_16235 [Parafrankia colletiae]
MRRRCSQWAGRSGRFQPGRQLDLPPVHRPGYAERPGRHPAAASIFSFDYPYLPFYAGTSYTALGRPEKARTFAQQAVTLCDAAAANWPVARALARVDLALAAVRQKEPDRACAVTVEALEICATERPLDLIVRRTGEVVQEMRSYQALPSVRDLRERQTSLARMLRGAQKARPETSAGSAARDRQADTL